MSNYYFKTMTSFTTLLFTESLSRKSCSNLECPPNQELFCVEITQAKERPLYIPMYDCAMKEFKCSVADAVKLNIVEMWKCYRTMPPPPPDLRRAENDLPESFGNIDDSQVTLDFNSSQALGKNCPKGCSPKSFMVCARCGHGVYRSFLSDCYMRVYQCLHPEEKLELVSRRSCQGSAPYMFDESKPEKERLLHREDAHHDADKQTLGGVIHEEDFTHPHEQFRTPKPTVDVEWPSRHTKTRTTKDITTSVKSSKTTKSKRTRKSRKPRTEKTQSPDITISDQTTTKVDQTTTKVDQTTTKVTTLGTDTTEPMTIRTTSAEEPDDEEVTQIDVDICPNDEDQETTISVPNVCPKKPKYDQDSLDYMKVDLHPDHIEDGSPVWMVFKRGRKITSQLRTDAGLVVGCEAFAGVDYSGNVIVRNKHDNDFLGFVFGYQNNKQFYLVTWKSKAGKYWIGSPNIVKADAGLHIKLVNSETGPSAYLRNALYSTESVKHQVYLLWQDPKKQGWKHLIMYTWQLIHRPHIGLIRVKVFRGSKLIVDSGNVYDSTLKGGRIGVYSFSQENIEWSKMKYKCNDKIPSNLMSELPPDLQKISVADSDYKWSNDTM